MVEYSIILQNFTTSTSKFKKEKSPEWASRKLLNLQNLQRVLGNKKKAKIHESPQFVVIEVALARCLHMFPSY